MASFTVMPHEKDQIGVWTKVHFDEDGGFRFAVIDENEDTETEFDVTWEDLLRMLANVSGFAAHFAEFRRGKEESDKANEGEFGEKG